MQVNVNKLRGKITERGMTQGSLARELSMVPSTFSRKMSSNALTFSIGEMHRISEILQLSPAEAEEIFLAESSH